MANLCLDSCERDGWFIEKHMNGESFEPYVCCCCCPIMSECKQEDDGVGCHHAFEGKFNSETCGDCKSCKVIE